VKKPKPSEFWVLCWNGKPCTLMPLTSRKEAEHEMKRWEDNSSQYDDGSLRVVHVREVTAPPPKRRKKRGAR